MKKNPKILIVDDEPDLREILEERFQIFNYDTLSAGSGNDAWAILQKQSVDAILSDIRMNNGSGLELLKLVKTRDPHAPRFFLMTGYHEDFKEHDLLDQGADGFFEKPFDAAKIRDVVQKALIPDRERWAFKDRYSPNRKIELNLEKNPKAPQLFHQGRLGFSILEPAGRSKPKEILEFDLRIPGMHLKGMGIVQWIRTHSSGLEALGVEILYLDNESMDLWIRMTKEHHPVASIPLI